MSCPFDPTHVIWTQA
ncbi:hypothetical protein EYS06_23360 [Escherichia albertii]|uniref:CHHC U11-48K-type domain-containing protein n=1 Tax=Escherichia albertii TaxID=208962 RepID=A0A7Z7YIF4_ESCAL|nr:hypothetical protein EYS06_23360 [Escherichia albertii]